jgi:ubiquinone/menaquinone biosynthesis C-methylase UbiE
VAKISFSDQDARDLREKYEELATSLKYETTSCDYNLRELEIDLATEYLFDGARTLDVGCGLGYAVIQYASRKKIEAHGIDYAANMIKGAEKLLNSNKPALQGTIKLSQASVLELPYPDKHFDVVTSSRCLMALLDWQVQKTALIEIWRVLKDRGTLVLMEGTFEGLERLNNARRQFGLDPIPADGRERLYTMKFHEEELLEFCQPFYRLERIQRFGMYYLLSRIVHPLLVAPKAPRYDHKINRIARKISEFFPDFEGLGHLTGFIFIKKERSKKKEG